MNKCYNTPYPKPLDMIGLTFAAVVEDGDALQFTMPDGTGFVFHHHDECCESVSLEEVIGDLADLVGSPITMAEEVSSEVIPAKDPVWDDSFTWTFYKFATTKGYVTARWYGTGNGYYGESVDMCRL